MFHFSFTVITCFFHIFFFSLSSFFFLPLFPFFFFFFFLFSFFAARLQSAARGESPPLPPRYATAWTPPYAPLMLAAPSYSCPRIFRISVTFSISVAMTAVGSYPFWLSTSVKPKKVSSVSSGASGCITPCSLPRLIKPQIKLSELIISQTHCEITW